MGAERPAGDTGTDMANAERNPCVYCGKLRKLTRDHIPPKNLFPRPRPRLITVPCCTPCNEEASKDDEYFRLMVAIRQDTGDHPEVKKLLPTIYRSLERRAQFGFTNALL